MNRYKGIIGKIIDNQKTLIKESLDGTVLKEQYSDFDAYVERVSEAYWKIEKRLKYLCPIKTFQIENGATVIYTGFCSSLGNDIYTQVVCFCEWADEALPKIVTITNSYGNPQTILKRAFNQEPTSLEFFAGNKLKASEEAKQYKVSATDLEKEGCKVNRKGGMAVERYWLSFVEKIDNQNKENRKQEWVKKQEESYTPEVKDIDSNGNGESWTIKTSFKFAKRSKDTLSHYQTVWQDSSGELYGFGQNDTMHKFWCPSVVELWSINPENLEMENVKEGVEKAVNKVVQNASWFEYVWRGRYHNMKKSDWQNDIPRSFGMNDYINNCKDFYNNELSKKLPLKLVKWEKIER